MRKTLKKALAVILTLMLLTTGTVNAFAARVLVKSPAGVTLTVESGQEETVEELKAKLEQKTGIPAADQLPVFKNMVMEDGKTLFSLGVSDSAEATVTLFRKSDSVWKGSCGENAEYTLDRTTGLLTVKGSGSIAEASFSRPYIKDEIKKVVIREGITGIGSCAFTSCSAMTAVEIPSSVTNISVDSFDLTKSLTSVSVAQGNPVYDSRNGCNAIIETATDTLFKGCLSTVIPDGITAIGRLAFFGLDNLKEIEIPSSVVLIDTDAFAGCRQLSMIYYWGTLTDWNTGVTVKEGNIPFENIASGDHVAYAKTGTWSNGDAGSGEWLYHRLLGTLKIRGTGKMNDLTSGDSAPWAQYKNDIKNVTVGNGIMSVGNYSFSGYPLEKAVLPESLTRIGAFCLKDCTALKEINIPAGVSEIAIAAFSGCTGLESAVLPAGITAVSANTFFGCTSLNKAEIPYGVTSIGDSAFCGCRALKEIEIPDSVTSIETAAFKSCGFADIIIPSAVTAIKENTFSDCRALKSVELAAGTASVGDSAFGSCGNLSDVFFRGTETDRENMEITANGNRKFTGAAWHYAAAGTWSNGTKGSGEWFFWEDGGRLTVTGTGEMCDFLYSGAPWSTYSDKITAAAVRCGITVLGKYSFGNCQALTDVRLPYSLSRVGNFAFYRCSSLKGIVIPGNVTDIGEGAFFGCQVLESTELPLGVTEIKIETFHDCFALKTVKIPGSVTKIGYYAFYNCKALESISIPDSVTYMGDSIFCNCISLTEVKLPAGITAILSNTFDSCLSLKTVEIPEGVTSIGAQAFHRCTALEAIKIPDGAENIGEEAFYNCQALTEVTLPLSLTVVGVSAFSTCNALTDVYYAGGEADRDSITVGKYNTDFDSAAWHYYCGRTLPAVFVLDPAASGADNIFFACGVSYGDLIQQPAATPGKDGYRFNGWLDCVSGKPADFTTETMNSPDGRTFCPDWKGNNYNAVFKADGQTVDTVSYAYGDTALTRIPSVPAKPGYSGVWETYALGIGGVTVNAVYTPVQYSAVFKVDGRTVDTVFYTYGDTALSRVPALPAKAGYSGIWEAYTLGVGGVTVNADYTPLQYNAVFKADGRTVDTVTYTYGDTALSTVPSVPSKPGYTGVWETYVLGTGGVTVNAVYTPVQYSAVFVADGQTVDTVSYTYGDTALSRVPAVPAKDGYSGEWESYTLGIGGVTVNAVYTENQKPAQRTLWDIIVDGIAAVATSLSRLLASVLRLCSK